MITKKEANVGHRHERKITPANVASEKNPGKISRSRYKNLSLGF